MKNFKTLIIASAIAVANLASAQEVITVKVNKAVKPLVEQWANAYQTEHPGIEIQFVSKGASSADLTYISNHQDNEAVAYVGRYALLPITSTSNPLFDDLNRRNWDKSDIKKLFFTDANEAYDEDDSEMTEGRAGKLRTKLTVYSGSSLNSYASAFASFFGFSSGEIRGNKIAGDDIFLINAINKDLASISFNTLANLYDTKTRTLKQSVAILPLNVKKEIAAALASGNLDEALLLLENSSSDLIPVEEFGFAYNSGSDSVKNFLEWIVIEGQKYNHANGFLELSAGERTEQLSAFHGGNANSNLIANNK